MKFTLFAQTRLVLLLAVTCCFISCQQTDDKTDASRAGLPLPLLWQTAKHRPGLPQTFPDSTGHGQQPRLDLRG